MACFLWGTVGAQSLGSCLQWLLLSSVSDGGAGQALSYVPMCGLSLKLSCVPFFPWTPFCLVKSFPLSKLILLLLKSAACVVICYFWGHCITVVNHGKKHGIFELV